MELTLVSVVRLSLVGRNAFGARFPKARSAPLVGTAAPPEVDQFNGAFQLPDPPSPTHVYCVGVSLSSRGSILRRCCGRFRRRTRTGPFLNNRASHRPQIFAFMVCIFQVVQAVLDICWKRISLNRTGKKP